jgi:putative flippase GtrA
MTVAPSYIDPKEWQRVRRFLVVGLSSTALDFILLTLLKSLGISTLAANTLAFSLATFYNFTASRRWTYAGAGQKHVGVQFSLFVIASLLGLLLNDAIVVLLEAPLRAILVDATWSYLPAKVIATGAVAIWSYTTNRIWVFSDGR